MTIIKNIKSENGQATVELAIMIPVILIIAVIAINAMTFFSACSKFDRSFKQIVSSIASSPAYGQNISNIRSILVSELEKDFDNQFLEFSVGVENVSGNYQSFNGELKMRPTLFGMGLRSEIFGVNLPMLSHHQKIVVEVYKPGIIF